MAPYFALQEPELHSKSIIQEFDMNPTGKPWVFPASSEGPRIWRRNQQTDPQSDYEVQYPRTANQGERAYGRYTPWLGGYEGESISLVGW